MINFDMINEEMAAAMSGEDVTRQERDTTSEEQQQELRAIRKRIYSLIEKLEAADDDNIPAKRLWLTSYILPRWADHAITDLQARPVELWLHSQPVAPKSKSHIRSLVRILCDYAMWRGDVPTERNPMELVSIKGVTKRVRKPRSLTVHEFQLLLAQFEHDLCFRTFALVAVIRASHLRGARLEVEGCGLARQDSPHSARRR